LFELQNLEGRQVKAVLRPNWFENFVLASKNFYSYNQHNKEKFAGLVVNHGIAKNLSSFEEETINGMELHDGRKTGLLSLKRLRLLEFEQLSPKPNRKYFTKLTPLGIDVKKNLERFANEGYPKIREETRRDFNLLEDHGLA
jgi:hypothetical protein